MPTFFLHAVLPSLLVLLGLAPAILVIYLFKRSNQFRHSPLTRNLLRPPGYTLQLQVEELSSDLLAHAFYAMLLPLIGFIFVLLPDQAGTHKVSIIVMMISFVILGEIFVCRRIWKIATDRRYKLLGLEGEMAVAEELNQLMLDGCRVFHDVKIEYGNIDHVVISRSGVYSIDTKMLGKADTHSDDANVIVDHTTHKIHFPDRVYDVPVGKLEMQAKCLQKFLTSAVGQTITVEPMLALPGWYIQERKGRGNYYVFNPHKPQKFFLHERKVISPQLQEQIAHHLDQLCRSFEPSYQKEKGW